jgi:hypothetical protein
VKWLACQVLGVGRASLNGERYQRLLARMNELSRNQRWTFWRTALPGAVALAMVPFWMLLARHFSFVWRFAFECTFALCVLAYVHWLLRSRYTRFGWRALRDLGYADVCGDCGYDLSRHPQPEGACPECGERFSQFHPAQTGSTGQR